MAELKCPHCGQAFTVDDTELSSIVQQIRDGEFEKDLNARVSDVEKHLKEKHKLELESQENTIKLQTKEEYEKEIEKLKDSIRKAEEEAQKLQGKLDATEAEKKLAVMEAVQKVEASKRVVEDEKRQLELDLTNEKRQLEIALTNEKHQAEIALNNEKEKAKIQLAQKDEQIEYYRDLKAKMSTKMVGETLEQHCEIQFNQLRATAFKNAYFEKDNDARTGSKGDYIYRECDENGVEIISIMFEMKNQMETTATKHKNEDFFKELDKDRNEKKCEYAVLVSLLEEDSELYNSGIVDVSYRYDKMYVIRPQFFIPMITLLRNAAMNALIYKQQLVEVKNQEIDVTNFEENLLQFKNEFGRNYELAHKHFESAIDEIDKTISHLEKVKKELLGSDNQLRLANNKVEDVSVKKLTKNSPSIAAKFETK